MRASATHNCSTDPTRHLHGPWRTATGVNALGCLRSTEIRERSRDQRRACGVGGGDELQRAA